MESENGVSLVEGLAPEHQICKEKVEPDGILPKFEKDIHNGILERVPGPGNEEGHGTLEKLQEQLVHSEMCNQQSSEEISHLKAELHKYKVELETSLVHQAKLKDLESDAARLTEELTASQCEAGDLKSNVETMKERHEELTNQVNGLREKVSLLEEELSAANVKTRESEETLLSQLESHKAELARREEHEEGLRKAHTETQLELEAVRGKVVELESALSHVSIREEEYQKELESQKAALKESLDSSERFKAEAETVELKFNELQVIVKSLQDELDEKKSQLLEGAHLLEETKAEMAKVKEEFCQVSEKVTQLEGEVEDGKAHFSELESKLVAKEEDLKSHVESFKEIEEVSLKAKAQVVELEGMLKAAEATVKEKEEANGSLQEQVKHLESKVEDLLRAEQVKTECVVKEHQEQLKAAEDKYLVLENSLSEMELKASQLQESLVCAESDAEASRKRTIELQEELEDLRCNKVKFDEESVVIKGKLKSTEEMLSQQSDRVKEAEENAGKANEQVSHLESVLRAAEEKLNANSVLLESMQLKEEVSKDSFQKLQLELEEKLSLSEDRYNTTVPKLEEKVLHLEESLRASLADNANIQANVSDLEQKLQCLHHEKCDIEQRLKISEGKCSEFESNANSSVERGIELESLISHHKSMTDDAVSKVAALESALSDAQSHIADLETNLKLAQEKALVLESAASESSKHSAEVEDLVKTSAAKLAEIELACADAKQKEQEALEKLSSYENLLKERQIEIECAIQKISEQESLISNIEAERSSFLEKEKKLSEEKDVMSSHVHKLEADVVDYHSRISELDLVVEKTKTDLEVAQEFSKQKEQEMAEKLGLTEKLLVEKQNELQSSIVQIAELESSISGIQANLNELLGKEKHTSDEKAVLEGTVAKLEAAIHDLELKVSTVDNLLEKTTAELSEVETNKTELETKLKEAEDKLEGFAKESSVKISELQMALETEKQKENEMEGNLAATEKLLLEKQAEAEHATKKQNISVMEADFIGKVEKEKHEKDRLEEKVKDMEDHSSKLEAEILQAQSKIAEFEQLVDKAKEESHVASASEVKLKDEILSYQACNSKLQDQLSQVENERRTIIEELESTQKSFDDLNKKLVEESTQLQSQIGALKKENEDLSEKLVELQEKLRSIFEERELSSRELKESVSRESTLAAEVADMKNQLTEASSHHAQLEKLQEELKNSIAREQHELQIKQVLATLKDYENKLAEAEQKLSHSNLEICKAQKAYSEQETHVKDLEAKIEKAEVINQESPELTKSRELDLDFESIGKVRQRKKKGVSWETDSDPSAKTKATGKVSQPLARGSHHFFHYLIIAVVSLTAGIWLSGKIGL